MTSDISALIWQSFGTASKPIGQIVLETIDDEGTAAFFLGRDVRRVLPYDVLSHLTSLWFFSPEAFIYYLPPFVDHALHTEESPVAGHLIAQFGSNLSKSREDRAQTLICRMTEGQRRALMIALGAIGEGPDVVRAIDRLDCSRQAQK